ncbi:hypothetical protein [Actomonas aquatica]|uniref:Uncharacterized protein n=1 Tax=Actomonas aquatica TaxID=2866162 RepID=A0ABZ1C7W9_9BACT|nr:hypothetical protein [Opitutus sp. WL0086]WRQ87368.1 hypothetical protein K1X11_021350 [Opitutus sp. WL0086]
MSATSPEKDSGSAKSLWIGVGLLFGLLAVAWVTLFTLASKNPVETVPLENRSAP